MIIFLILSFIGLIPFFIFFKCKTFFYKKPFGFFLVYIFTAFFFAIGLMAYGAEKMNTEKNNEVYKNGEVFLYKNEVGCSKFKYYESIYYRCPKEMNINNFEEDYSYSCGKSTCKKTVSIPVKQY